MTVRFGPELRAFVTRVGLCTNALTPRREALHVVSIACRCLSSFACQRNRAALGLTLPSSKLPRSARTADTLNMEHDTPSNRRFTKAIEQLTKQGNYAEAWKVFDSIEQKNTIVYSAMLAGAVRCGRYSQGVELFESLRTTSLALTEPVYVSAMALYGGCSRCVEGLELFNEMRKLGIANNVPPYTTAIQLCGKLSRHQQANDIWEDMIARGLRPTGAAFTAIMSAAASVGDLAEVQRHLDAMASYELQPSRSHLGCMLKACRCAGDADRAEKLLHDMADGPVKPDVVHYTIVMGIYRASGLAGADPEAGHSRVSRLAARMSQQGVAPDKFFLEEHLAAVLGGSLQQVLDGSLAPTPPAAAAARRLLEAARRSGTQQTRVTQAVERWLAGGTPTAAAGSAQRPGDAGGLWLEAADPASGRSYYYHSRTRAVSWERPAGGAAP
ncbi:unnamed protein product [Prorocentrum cordatum]|uniref:WW domain-containing protein n=1 Tax=Prorocentrum cordatum TaxID=2364126 RepID=A0ABN9P6E4_9DINO|nr:unnamed protein product [Polarella glacialis]